jgi:hypothetical protein
MPKPINTKIFLKFSSSVPPVAAGGRFLTGVRATPLHSFRLLTDPTISTQKHFNHFKTFHTTTIKMAPTKEYALLCLENPLLGMFQIFTSIEIFPISQHKLCSEATVSTNVNFGLQLHSLLSHLYESTKTVEDLFETAQFRIIIPIAFLYHRTNSQQIFRLQAMPPSSRNTASNPTTPS